MAEVHTTPQMERERPQFEAWMIKSTACQDGEAKRLLERDAGGAYVNDFVAHAWNGWVGHAAQT